jgi:hypothetical protein
MLTGGREHPVTTYFVIAAAFVVALAVGVAAFLHPRRVILRSVIAAVCAVVGPFVVAYAAAPLLGEGAGMGVAFILYACAAVVLLVAIAATFGAVTRHAWTALRGAGG